MKKILKKLKILLKKWKILKDKKNKDKELQE